MSATACEAPRVLAYKRTCEAGTDGEGRLTVTVRGDVTFARVLGQRALVDAAWKHAHDSAGPVPAGWQRRELSLTWSEADGTASYRVVDRAEGK
jgi:hypothetical protein